MQAKFFGPLTNLTVYSLRERFRPCWEAVGDFQVFFFIGSASLIMALEKYLEL